MTGSLAALLDFTAACAALESCQRDFPAPLVKLTCAAHTFASIEAQRLQGRRLTPLDVEAGRAALHDLERAVGELRAHLSGA